MSLWQSRECREQRKQRAQEQLAERRFKEIEQQAHLNRRDEG